MPDCVLAATIVLSGGMARYDFSTPRLFVEDELLDGGTIALDKPRQNYLSNVLRMRAGDRVLVFNGRDGEFTARLALEGKRAALSIDTLTRGQEPRPALRWLFAPLKHARLDYMVQKAVELGVGLIEPVITRRTQVSRVNIDRMRANVVEAAEQCGVLAIPKVLPEVALDRRLAGAGENEWLVFCDEDAPIADPLAALSAVDPGPVTLLIGPEGGFDDRERAALLHRQRTVRLALGPRILRADTAAVAALSLIQAVRGDWRG
jgi:16S rRNA (uracil1498-N3)-methyltransferase